MNPLFVQYLGLVGLISLMRSQPRVVVEHRDIILLCLHDADFTIRTKALELLAGIVSKKSLSMIKTYALSVALLNNRLYLVEIVKHLLGHISKAEGSYRDQIIITILQMCSREKYALLSDFAWYVSVLVYLASLRGCGLGANISSQLMDVSLRVEDVRAFAVHSLLPFLLDEELLQSQTIQHADHVHFLCL